MQRAILALQLLFSVCTLGLAQERGYYFYRPLPYGSEAMYNPISLILNGGFDVLQNHYSSSQLSDIMWDVNATNVWRNITSPLPVISQYGWNNFLRHEVLPTSLNHENAQFVPNYLLHTLGGGLEFRKVWEWYDYHGFPVPQLFAGLTTLSYEFLNEVVENGNKVGPTTDPIADLLIFDPLGIVLFSFNPVADFFSSQLELAEWQGQFAVMPFRWTIFNYGQSFVARYPVVPSRGTSAFFLLGETALLGITKKVDTANAISFGIGGTELNVYTVDVTNGVETKSIKAGLAFGVYYDRNNSLLASLLLGNGLVERVRLNVFPGLWEYRGFSPGLFAFLDKSWKPAFGVTIRCLPIGLALYHTP